MEVTNKKREGYLGFFHSNNPIIPVLVRPGETVDVQGFDPSLPSHAAMLDAGIIAVPASDHRTFMAKRDKERRAADAAEAERQKRIAEDEAAAEAERKRVEAEAAKQAKAGQAPV